MAGAPAPRVVVTGMGLVTCLGASVAGVFDAMAAGRSGIRRLTRFDPTGLPCEIGGEVDLACLVAEEPEDLAAGSALRLLRTAAREALDGGAALAGVDPRRVGVALGGHGATPPRAHLEACAAHVGADGALDPEALAADPRFDEREFTRRSPEWVPTRFAQALGARGPVLPVVSACAAGTQALGEALHWIREGRADVVLAGGTEPLLGFSYYAGFALLGALTRRYPSPAGASRPFDRRRNGFVIAEGAALLVLESLDGARRRGRPVRGEVLGYGDSADGYRITDPPPQGDGALAAMQAALRDAGLGPEAVQYVNAHGTSTPVNDPVETLAIKRLLGARAAEVPVSSNKSMIGHAIGAAGAIEAVLTLEGMRRGVLLPTINQEAPDPRCDLDYVPNAARALAHEVALSNSFGFGGQNGCLCLGAARDLARAR